MPITIIAEIICGLALPCRTWRQQQSTCFFLLKQEEEEGALSNVFIDLGLRGEKPVSSQLGGHWLPHCASAHRDTEIQSRVTQVCGLDL